MRSIHLLGNCEGQLYININIDTHSISVFKQFKYFKNEFILYFEKKGRFYGSVEITIHFIIVCMETFKCFY